MRKWKEFWQESLPYEKVFRIASLILTGLILILVVLVLCRVLPDTLGIFTIAIGLMVLDCACDAVVWWRRERFVAIICIAAVALFAALTIWGITKVYC